MEAGHGTPLVHLHGAGGVRLTPGHDRLRGRHRVIGFEMPGFGLSPENTRSRTMPELAGTMAAAISNLGIDKFNLMGTSFAAKPAHCLGVQQPERGEVLGLEVSRGIRPLWPRPPSVSAAGTAP